MGGALFYINSYKPQKLSHEVHTVVIPTYR